jgi:uncharacterized protein (DUF433 family)
MIAARMGRYRIPAIDGMLVARYSEAMAEVVSVNPNILGGTAVFAGTRVPIESLFDTSSTAGRSSVSSNNSRR